MRPQMNAPRFAAIMAEKTGACQVVDDDRSSRVQRLRSGRDDAKVPHDFAP